MAESLNIKKGDSFVDGPRSPEKARELLALAEEHGIEKSRILTTSGGYIVPSVLVSGSGKLSAQRVADTTEADAANAQEAADAKEAQEAEDAKAAADAALFNPSEHGVDVVVAYLAEADEDEKARVIAAETEGKNRVTITGAESEGAK